MTRGDQRKVVQNAAPFPKNIAANRKQIIPGVLTTEEKKDDCLTPNKEAEEESCII